MKRTLLPILTVFLLATSLYSAESTSSASLPNIDVKDIKGKTVNMSEISNNGKPIVINFWATWCKPCINELNTIADVYEEWQEESGVKIYAVSIDDSRNVKRVAPFVKGRGWDYEVLTDENSELRRALNVNNPPHTLLLNGNGEIVWEHNGYMPGDEMELYDEIMKLVEKE
ncbi:MAG: hypothetical protein Kapaf2KO_19360 [Candidatus Kapaibacteriales bacterium]